MPLPCYQSALSSTRVSTSRPEEKVIDDRCCAYAVCRCTNTSDERRRKLNDATGKLPHKALHGCPRLVHNTMCKQKFCRIVTTCAKLPDSKQQ
eukprot:scaffold63300_cov22-Prasinocladus_malaysianus.AAC.1